MNTVPVVMVRVYLHEGTGLLKEVFAYLLGSIFFGSGGCNLMLFTAGHVIPATHFHLCN